MSFQNYNTKTTRKEHGNTVDAYDLIDNVVYWYILHYCSTSSADLLLVSAWWYFQVAYFFNGISYPSLPPLNSWMYANLGLMSSSNKWMILPKVSYKNISQFSICSDSRLLAEWPPLYNYVYDNIYLWWLNIWWRWLSAQQLGTVSKRPCKILRSNE